MTGEPWPELARDIARRLKAGATVRAAGDTVEIHLAGHSISWTDRRHYEAALKLLEGAPEPSTPPASDGLRRMLEAASAPAQGQGKGMSR